VLRETTSRGLCGLVCPSRTSERKGDCVKEGGGELPGEEGERPILLFKPWKNAARLKQNESDLLHCDGKQWH
jgi:hypothetical protein